MFLKSQGRPGPKGTAYPRFRAAGPPGAVRVRFDLFLSGPAGGEAFFWGRQRAAKKERPERAKSTSGPRNKTKVNLCFLHSFCGGISLEAAPRPPRKGRKKTPPRDTKCPSQGYTKSPPFPKRGRAGACALCGGDALSTYPSSRRPGRCTHAAPQARARGDCRPDGPGSRT